MGQLFFNTQTTDFTRHYSDSTKDPKCVQFEITLKLIQTLFLLKNEKSQAYI